MNAWRPTRGTWTVARLELRQRLRSTRWQIALAAWFVVIGALTVLVSLATRTDIDGQFSPRPDQGPETFGLVVFFVLGLGLLVTPALAAGGVNGDRAAGTLATLQMSRLTACDIALGKLLAAWSVALAFLVVSLPFIVWGLAQGGTSVVKLLVCLGVLALELAVVCAIGLGLSALITRSIGSTLVTYLVVAALAGGSVVLFAMSSTLVTETLPTRTFGLGPDYTYTDWTFTTDTDPGPSGTEAENQPADPTPDQCYWYVADQTFDHTERIWWLLAPNPFVIVADAAPARGGPDGTSSYADPLSSIRDLVRTARLGAPSEVDDCMSQTVTGPSYRSPVPERSGSMAPVWPWGLACNLLLGLGGFALAVRRLSIPYRKLPRGVRVA